MGDQSKIWEYYQNVTPDVFLLSRPRLDFLLEQVRGRARAKDARILSIGSGDGYFEETAAAAGFSIVSLDPDEGVVKRLRTRGIESHHGSIAKLPFDPRSFDFAVASEVLEHLDEGVRAQGLSEVARILKTDGWFLGTVPYRENLSDHEVVCPACGNVFHRWGHLKSFSLSAMRGELEPHFGVVELKRTAFGSKKRTLLGKAKSMARLLLAKYGASVASPSLYFAAGRPLPAKSASVHGSLTD